MLESTRTVDLISCLFLTRLLHYVREARLLAAGIEVATDGWRLPALERDKRRRFNRLMLGNGVEQQVLAG